MVQGPRGMLVIVVQPIELRDIGLQLPAGSAAEDSQRCRGVRGSSSGSEACGCALLLVDCCAVRGAQLETVATVGLPTLGTFKEAR